MFVSRNRAVCVGLLCALATAQPAEALTRVFNISGGFSGGELGDVSYDFTIEADFTQSYSDETLGLTVNSFTSSILAGDPVTFSGVYGFTYVKQLDRLFFGTFGPNASAVTGVLGASNDFRIDIVGLMSNPSVGPTFVDSIAGTLNFSEVTSESLDVIESIPVPTGAPLLLGALGTLAYCSRRRRRT